MTKKFYILIFLLINLVYSQSKGSEFYNEKIGSIDFIGNKIFSNDYLVKKLNPNVKENFNDDLYNSLSEILKEYKDLGYYNVRIDSVSFIKNTKSTLDLKIYIYEGERIKIKGIVFDGNKLISDKKLSDIFRIYEGNYFIENEIENGMERIIKWFEENGYPFSKVELDKECVNDVGKKNDVLLKLNIYPDTLVKIDSIAVIGNNYTKRNLIIRKSGLLEGELFNQKLLNNISKNLENTDFVTLDGKPQLVTFNSSKNGILLKIVEKSSNSFDGILGYVPSQKYGNSSKGQINGFVDVVFGNLFGTGRSISVKWENRGGFSQDLNLKYSEPYFLNLPVALSTSFSQSVHDSTFLKRDFMTEFILPLNNRASGFFSCGYETTTPDKFGMSEYNISNAEVLYGRFGLTYDSRDSKLNPRRGIYYSTFYSIGKRKNLENRYNSGSPGRYIDRKMIFDFQVSIPTAKRSSIYTLIYGANISSSEGNIPYSQLFMLGGANSLRGYRERQFLGSTIGLVNLEYRYLLGEKSRIFLFYDCGYVNKQKNGFYKSGYGWGFRVDSKIGLLGFDYGIGEGDSPANGKIHFGVKSNF